MTDIVTLETGPLAFRGGAVARDPEGKVVFVRGAAPGEVVEARRVQRRSRFDLAELTRIRQPSPDRVEPFCPLAGVCGGCDWQHVAPDAQRSAKQTFLADALSRAGVDLKPEPVVSGPEYRAWRHRARLHLDAGRGGLRLGFFRPGTHEVIDAPDCPVLAAPLLDAAAAVRKALTGHVAEGTVELSLADEGVLATLHLSTAPRDPDGLLLALAQSPALRGGVLAAPGAGSRRFGEVTGTKALEVDGRRHRIPVTAGGFLQANWGANALLVAQAVAEVSTLAPKGGRVTELYAGSGNMTLPLLAAGLTVEAWESAGPAVKALKAASPPGARLRVRRGDAALALAPEHSTELPDVVLLDPPRAGARAVCERLCDLPVRGVVYVSCDPNTLGRDLGILVAGGWRLDRVTPVDLFPHTPHIEAVTSLSRP